MDINKRRGNASIARWQIAEVGSFRAQLNISERRYRYILPRKRYNYKKVAHLQNSLGIHCSRVPSRILTTAKRNEQITIMEKKKKRQICWGLRRLKLAIGNIRKSI
jgi:tRNA U38,U39,U40 pseudouridine synthase TruA